MRSAACGPFPFLIPGGGGRLSKTGHALVSLVPFFNLPLAAAASSGSRAGGFQDSQRNGGSGAAIEWFVPALRLALKRFPPLYSFRWGIIWPPDSPAYLTRRRSSQPLSSHASGRARPGSSSSRTPRRHLSQHRLGPGSTASPGLPPRCARLLIVPLNSLRTSESIAVRAE